MIWLLFLYYFTVHLDYGRQLYRNFRIILVGDQLAGMKAICACNRCLHVQIGINPMVNNQLDK